MKEIKKEQIEELLNSGKSINEILKILKISQNKYYELRKEAGIFKRKKGAGRPKGSYTIKLV
ncbi:hypothetical protein EOM39_01205 [Candidatus Gracilibacteria bacterium]|nr:hypothetical protein [Candidatus Gracilibacteria bacterium]